MYPPEHNKNPWGHKFPCCVAPFHLKHSISSYTFSISLLECLGMEREWRENVERNDNFLLETFIKKKEENSA